MNRQDAERDGAGEAADWEALGRFLAGESPAEEADAVHGWLSEDPDRPAVLGALDRALDHASPPADESPVDVEAALLRARARMDAPASPVVSVSRPSAGPPPSTRRAARWGSSPALRIAAMVLVVLGGAFLLWRGTGSRTLASPSLEVWITGVGERDSLRLADGTRVLLGPGSRLTVDATYGDARRDVVLRGDAMFTVAHDDARPFTVHAGDARVRDIGTAFTVRTEENAGVRVVVTEGAVALRSTADSGDEMLLRRGEAAVLPAGRTAPERAAVSADELAWTRGRLVFRDAPLDEVSAELRRWYGVEVRAGDAAVAARGLTAEFGGETREEVLRVIGLALGADVEVRGDTAVLRVPGGAPR
jgi:transmembrane sensor